MKVLSPLIAGDVRSRAPTSRARLLSRIAYFDIAWASISPMLAFLVRDGIIGRPSITAVYTFVAIIASVTSFQWFKISSPLSSFFSVHDASKVVQACLTTVALTAVVLFTLTRLDDAPRSIPFIHFLLLVGGLLCQRTLTRILERPRAHFGYGGDSRVENVLIIEASRLSWFFCKMVEEFMPGSCRIIAILDERPEFYGRTVNGVSIIGAPGLLSKIVEEYAIHGVDIHKIAISTHRDNLRPELLADIERTCSLRNIKIEWLHERLGAFPIARAGKLPGAVTDSEPAWASGASVRYLRIKYLIEAAFAVALLIIIAPLIVLAAGLVLVDVGWPIIFWQQRVGYLGRQLHVYKFRTMRSSYDRDGNPVPQSQRLSSLGSLLRRNRLDEIPQLFNVVVGDMSLVGPRPLLPVDQPRDIGWRLKVRPGLTGLAQINGGKLLNADEKDALDDWYVQHISFWLDLKILILTPWIVMRGDRRNETNIVAALGERKRRRGAAACDTEA